MSALLKLMESPDFPDSYKRAKWATAPQGAKNEYYYEKYLRNPARAAMRPMLQIPFAGKNLGSADSGLEKKIVPPDLQAAAQLAAMLVSRGRGGTAGQFGLMEAGGTAGGMLQGRGLKESAARALPGAVIGGAANYGMQKSPYYDRAISNRATRAASGSTAKLFRRLWKDHPDLRAPTTPPEMVDFYGSGDKALPIERAGASLGKFRDVIRTQPAFRTAQPIDAPIKWIDPVTKTPRYTTYRMNLPEAIEYQKGLQGKGYNIAGGARGGIWAEPDRALAAQMRGKILNSLNSIPRSGPRLANMYEDLSSDYGIAKTMQNVYTPEISDPRQMLNHEKLYQNASDAETQTHLSNLVGKDEADAWLQGVAPGRQRVFQPPTGGVGGHVGPVRVHVGISKAPIVPPEFIPPASRAIGPAIGQGVTNWIEEGSRGTTE